MMDEERNQVNECVKNSQDERDKVDDDASCSCSKCLTYTCLCSVCCLRSVSLTLNCIQGVCNIFAACFETCSETCKGCSKCIEQVDCDGK